MAKTIDQGSTSANPPETALMGLAANALLAIGSRVRQLRGERGLTLQALAEMTGLSASLLSLVERQDQSFHRDAGSDRSCLRRAYDRSHAGGPGYRSVAGASA